MKRLFYAMLFLLPLHINAQHTISGLITDKKDNSVLIDGVKVYVPEFDRSDESKAGGTFFLQNVGVGTVHVQFTKEGYETVLKVVNTKDSATVINIEMQKIFVKSEVVSPSTSFLKLPRNTPYPVIQKDANRIRRLGEPKLMTSLAYEPGIDVITIGQISKPSIRGLSGSHILLVQSGSRILTNRLDERYDYELVDNGTSEIEIIKGPASLQYGDNAMGGVIIFKDEQMPPPGKVTGDVNLSFHTNTMGLKSDVGLKGSANSGLFYSVRLGGNSQTSYVQGEGFEKEKNTEKRKYAYNSGSVMADAKGIIGISKKWGQTKISGTYWKRQSELVQSYSDAEIDTMKDVERDRKTMSPFVEQQATLISSQTTVLLSKSKLDANISWQEYTRSGSYTTSAVNYDVKYTTDPEKTMGFIVGSQGYFQNKDYAAYYSIFQNKLYSNSLYAMYRFDTEKINVLAGVRYDLKKLTTPLEELNNDYNFLNGSAGLAWHPVDQITIKLNGATGNSVPDEERYYFNQMYYGFLSSFDVKEETNFEADLGFEWKHRNVTLYMSAFYNAISDYTFVNSSNDVFVNGPLYSLDQEDAVITGGEAMVTVHPHTIQWVSLNAGYSVMNSEFRDSKLAVPNIPANKIVTSLRFESKRLDYLYKSYVEIMLRSYMERTSFFMHTDIPSLGYSLLDLRVGGSFHWGMQAFDVTLAVNNLLDEVYFSQLSRLKALKPQEVSDMGRNVAVIVRFPFGL